MRDFKVLIQQAHAKVALADNKRLWFVEMTDRNVYLYYNENATVDGFWLRKSDALNKKLKELVR